MPRSNDETANREPAHDLQEILEHVTSHVDVRLSAPMSSSVLGLHSAPLAHSGPAAGGSFGGGPRTTAPAGHPRPADPAASGYCGRRCVAGTVAWSRPCVVADGVVMQSGYQVRLMDVPN
jgi:hypothetical protein